YRWYPLANAVYHQQSKEDMEYRLTECKTFRRVGGAWYECGVHSCYFKKAFVGAFLHQTELSIRRYLKVGRYLHEKKGEEWVLPYVNAVIDEDRRWREEEARPKIEIDLEHLDDIREDAIRIRDSLLVDEELDEAPETPAHDAPTVKQEALPQESNSQLPIERRILRLLLDGESPDEQIKANRLMPSIVADSINEKFFDEIGDNIVECDNDRLTLVEDYADDVRKLMDMLP
ncbi:MAG: hypothetical protein IJS15_01970, partial [Victivallales bacterium]|nr:hypothetical protein [Victivallales bacterium]